ncbi:PTS sorbitol transporter subunit IIA [Dermabacter sp. HMSC06F07]|uniref:PTS glucitol/sorbitol transporter subunit IIA n=1 Tax=Dermabacter TaxID=36739 RepID=UPI0008A4D1F4|nr:PTS glucitol/sorbitol transporter subunit IIA [Dermabacter sp. HMSC06F07]MCT1709909.1 PTS glucitol/sorbitol transporter subunit IIA [Dermabacter hominis]MDK8803899.1 PTS glucitol/sorbitol transporter subunit IIA [Dermabacter hominis]OFT48637.1 PTS sorbitol transporter subunit IIA [Dermabacter sp. HMSC06F07]WIK61716.1 PTS glucitol/sorbitol transporter subunit IIA [Dermabacter hominis]
MSNELWSANISQIGADAEMMFSEGVIILFGEPVPPSLAEVALVHTGGSTLTRDLVVGDVVDIDGHKYTVTALGEIANKNLAELGHIVLYVNQPDQSVLPGAVLVSGPDEFTTPQVGAKIRVMEA